MSQAAAPVVQLGLVAAPGAPAELAGWLAGELGGELATAHPQVRREVRAVQDGLVQPPADDDEIVAATRRRLLAEDWDLALALTDVPLEVDRRPVVGSASPVHGVALLSLPALGAVGLRKRALQTALGLVRTLLGTAEDADADDRAAMGRRLRELFDVATTATVVIGVLMLYAVLFLLVLAGALLLVVAPLFAEGLGHPAHLSDYLELARLTCSLATVGGTLDAGLESDDAVREAAYTHRPEQPAP